MTEQRLRWVARAAAVGLALWTYDVAADRQEPLPKQLEGVGVTEHRGALLPEGTELADESGRAVRLGDFLHHGRPVLLTLNYFSCPMLCTVQLNELVTTLKAMPWSPGREFEIVTLSINPLEGPALAAAKKASLIGALGRPEAGQGWHFLTGKEPAIESLASAVGFSYAWVPDQGQYAHPAVMVLLTPKGAVSSYLYGVRLDPDTLRLALVDAGRGAIGTARDQILLFCFHYDASSGRYVVAAARLMQAGGALTVLALAATWALWWRSERRRGRAATTSVPSGGDA